MATSLRPGTPQSPRLARLVTVVLAIAALAAPAFAQPVQLDVTSATVTRDVGVTAALTMVLSPDSAKAFAALTTANVGRTIDIRIDGKTMLSPRLVEPIMGGELRISGSFSRDELTAIAARISAGTAKVEAEVVAP